MLIRIVEKKPWFRRGYQFIFIGGLLLFVVEIMVNHYAIFAGGKPGTSPDAVLVPQGVRQFGFIATCMAYFSIAGGLVMLGNSVWRWLKEGKKEEDHDDIDQGGR